MDSSNADRRVARLSDTENEIQQLKERISTLEAELAQMSVRNGLEKVKEQFAKKKASHESAVAVSKMMIESKRHDDDQSSDSDDDDDQQIFETVVDHEDDWNEQWYLKFGRKLISTKEKVRAAKGAAVLELVDLRSKEIAILYNQNDDEEGDPLSAVLANPGRDASVDPFTTLAICRGNDAIGKMQGELEQLEQEKNEAQAELKKWKHTHDLKERLFRKGRANELGKRQTMLRIQTGNKSFEYIRGIPDIDIINNRNSQMHDADFEATEDLFELGDLNSAQDYANTLAMFGIPVGGGIPSEKFMKIVNMHGNMYLCYSWSKRTRSEADDGDFKKTFNECVAFKNTLLKQCSGDKDAAAKKFDADPQMNRNFIYLKPIEKRIKNMERDRRQRMLRAGGSALG